MAFKNLSEYIDLLKQENELVICNEYVNPALEITEIADRFSKQEAHKNKAILFTNTGTDFPVLINALGSEKRMNLAFGTKDLDDVALRIDTLFKTLSAPKESLWDKLKMLPLLGELKTWMPKKKSGKGQCQEVIHTTPNLHDIPILKCWPHDGGKFITLPMVITQDPKTGIRNVGMYRMQVFDNTSTGMHWHLHKTGARHYNEYKEEGKRMPISVAIGGDPAHTFSATAPLPDNIDEFMLSGFLRQKHVELVKSITNDIYVPTDADFIIEGYVDPTEEKVIEGPFGDHTGFYSLPDLYPTFHVTCITHKKKAVYSTTIVGIPPMEDSWIGKATERIFLAPIKLVLVPEMLDYSMPFAGVAHNLVIAKITKTFAGQATKVMNTLWGAGQMMFNKTLIVVDQDCDIFNSKNLIETVLRNTDPITDIHISRGPLDVLDHSAPETGLGSKICVDATTKLEIEQTSFHKIPTPHAFKLVKITDEQYKDRHEIAEKIWKESPENTFIILYDSSISEADFNTITWHTLNNCDPYRDCKTLADSQNSCIVFDGTTKLDDITNRDWPTPVISSQETIDDISKKWDEYKIGEFLESPSNVFKKLSKKDSAWLYKQDNSKK